MKNHYLLRIALLVLPAFLLNAHTHAQTSMTVRPSVNITVAEGSSITVVNGNFVLKSGWSAGDFVSSPGASLIELGTTGSRVSATGTGRVYFERPFYKDETHLFSSPVPLCRFGVASPQNAKVYMFHEENAWDSDTSWTVAVKTDNMIPGIGYAAGYAFYNHSVNFTNYSGAPQTFNSGDITVPVTYTATVGSDEEWGRGWNLIGNPYPSALDWDQVYNYGTNNTTTYSAIYVWDHDRYLSYVPADEGATGGMYPVTVGGATNIIPAAQGFMVKAKLTGDIVIPNSARIHDHTEYFKSATVQQDFYRLKIENSLTADETVIRFADLANTNFDGRLDAYKLFTDHATFPDVPQISTLTPASEALSVNTLPRSAQFDTYIPLLVKTGKSGRFNFTFPEFTASEGYEVYFVDNIGDNGNPHQLLVDQNFIYEVDLETGSISDRFAIRFKALPAAETRIVEQPVSLYACAGSTVTFTIGAAGADLNYQWYRGDELLQNETGSNLTLASVNNLLAGQYTCRVSGKDGKIVYSEPASLKLETGVSASGLSDQTLAEGNTLQLRVNATGNGLSYQWFKDDVALEGATASDLVINNISLSQAGKYYCQVSGTCGTASSEQIKVAVTALGIADIQSSDLRVYPNPSQGKFFVEAKGGTLSHIEILDVAGRVIKAKMPYSNHTEIDLSNQEAGVYTVKLYQGDVVSTRKVFIVK